MRKLTVDMDETTGTSAQLSAIYQWFIGVDLSADSMSALAMFVEAHSMRTDISLPALKAAQVRLALGDNYDSKRGKLIKNWHCALVEQKRVLDKQEIKQCLSDIFSNIDRSVLFEEAITVGVTHIQRDGHNDYMTESGGSKHNWCLHYTSRGSGLYWRNEQELQTQISDIIIMRPDAKSYHSRHPAHPNWEHHWVSFNPRVHCLQWLQWADPDNDLFLVKNANFKSKENIATLVQQLTHIDIDKEYLADLQMNKLEEVLIHINAAVSDQKSDQRDPRIINICAQMSRNLAATLPITELAANNALSASRLAHLFKQEINLSPKAWLKLQRLQEARRLLLHSNNSIRVIAEGIGYNDPLQFSKMFRKSIGISPSQFRKNYRLKRN